MKVVPTNTGKYLLNYYLDPYIYCTSFGSLGFRQLAFILNSGGSSFFVSKKLRKKQELLFSLWASMMPNMLKKLPKPQNSLGSIFDTWLGRCRGWKRQRWRDSLHKIKDKYSKRSFLFLKFEKYYKDYFSQVSIKKLLLKGIVNQYIFSVFIF